MSEAHLADLFDRSLIPVRFSLGRSPTHITIRVNERSTQHRRMSRASGSRKSLERPPLRRQCARRAAISPVRPPPDCELDWCGKTCQDIQSKFPDCACPTWAAGETYSSVAKGKGKFGDVGEYSKGDFGTAA
ncbi:unnamed protein product [Prorocentrum cordatum]|uniref:Peptidylprolyl isomerase n=1 Tax=Prorocentrum cordatum TaxID=2364126 RepID=A0ABN9XGI9_9DINO|nr:unnamed protein product [Polarella glacialis]